MSTTSRNSDLTPDMESGALEHIPTEAFEDPPIPLDQSNNAEMNEYLKRLSEYNYELFNCVEELIW